MPTVQFTRHLSRFFPTLVECRINGDTVAAVVAELNRKHPGLADYLMDEHGALRKHVNIFVGDQLICDREKLSDPVGPDDQIFIMQALSGG